MFKIYTDIKVFRGRGSAEIFAGELRPPSPQLRNPFIFFYTVKRTRAVAKFVFQKNNKKKQSGYFIFEVSDQSHDRIFEI